MYLRTLALLACTTAASATTCLAQDWQTRLAPPAKAPAKAAPPATAARPMPPSQPAQAQTHYLVRTTLLALNDANRTGNYTVLRDLSAPSFRERNSAADLAHIFTEMRRAKLDLGIAAIVPPEFDGAPTLDADRRMHLKGHFATQPNRVLFDLQFEAVAGQWQLYGVSIATSPSSRSAAGGAVPGVTR